MSALKCVTNSTFASYSIPLFYQGIRDQTAGDMPIQQIDLQPRMLKELHFLIHPLFIGDPKRDDGRENDVRWIRQCSGKTKKMSAIYKSQVARLSENSAMCVFLHKKYEDLMSDESEYACRMGSLLSEMGQILGARMMVFTDDVRPFYDYSVAALISKELKMRNFSLHRTLRGFAYGEVIEECVPNAAMNLGEAFDFEKKIVVPARLTDAVLWWDDADEKDHRYNIRIQMMESGLKLMDHI